MSKVLIVDDDRKLRDLLRTYLSNQGLNVDLAESADYANQILDKSKYDLLIVDVMMPKISGIEFTKRQKRLDPSTPILMLTAVGETEDRIRGLESGADDYLTKPFDPKELYLRCMKLVNRFDEIKGLKKAEKKREYVEFGPFKFDMESRLLEKGKEKIYLSSKEAELMHILCATPNIPVSRYDLSQKFNGISERSVDVQVTRLRKKVEDDPKTPEYIQTDWGKGYVLRV
jgi:two-component system phosphate regulon response regulator OmpR